MPQTLNSPCPLLPVKSFFDVHEALSSVPRALHLETSGDNMTECLGDNSLVP